MSNKSHWVMFLFAVLVSAASQWILYKAGNPNAVWLFDMIAGWAK